VEVGEDIDEVNDRQADDDVKGGPVSRGLCVLKDFEFFVFEGFELGMH